MERINVMSEDITPKEIERFINRNYNKYGFIYTSKYDVSYIKEELLYSLEHNNVSLSSYNINDSEENVIKFFKFLGTAKAESSTRYDYADGRRHFFSKSIFEVFEFSESGLSQIVKSLIGNIDKQTAHSIFKHQKVSQRTYIVLSKKFGHEFLSDYIEKQNITASFILKNFKNINLYILVENESFNNLMNSISFEAENYYDYNELQELKAEELLEKLNDVILSGYEYPTKLLSYEAIEEKMHPRTMNKLLVKKIMDIEKNIDQY